MKTLIIVLFYCMSIQVDCVNYNEKTIKPLSISGELVNKEIIQNGKFFKFSIKKGDKTVFDVILLNCESTKRIYDFAQIKDRIEKDKGTLLIRIAHFFDNGIDVKKIMIECS